MIKIFDKLFKSNISGGNMRSHNSLLTLAPLLKSSSAFEGLLEKGYAVVPFMSLDEIEPLRKNLEIFNTFKSSSAPDLFYTSGRDETLARKMAKELSWPYVKDYLHRIINLEETYVEGCGWLLKPPGDAGGLSPHQDSSLVDETKYASFYGWMPLQDTTAQNGAVNVIPRSHLWGIDFRSLDVPWPLDDHRDLLMEYSVPIEIKAGEILLFEGALIHGSYINQTDNLRAALNFFFKPKEAPFCHFMRDDLTPPNEVESYIIDADFFYSHDFRKRPDTDIYPFYKKFEFDYNPMSRRRLMSLLKTVK